MYLESVISEINETHPKLGELIVLSHIAVKARKFMLLISPSGCGKSRAMEYVSKSVSGSYMPTSLSMASLANKVDLLCSFRSVIIVDDISVIQTPYARSATMTTLSALCYSHRVAPSMAGYDFEIDDFYGSALIGVQPVMLKDLMLSSEWEGSIQDKALRYYHLHRPLIPNVGLPQVKFDTGLDFDTVNDFEPDKSDKLWLELVEYGDIQWSRARVKEHLIDMLKAVASLENRREVMKEDYELLIKLLKPMTVENIVISKDSLEGNRYLDNNLLALLAEYYTYGEVFSLAHIARDYKISISQCYRIMKSQNGYWQQIQKSPSLYTPSKTLIKMLKENKLEYNSDDNKN